MDDDPCDESGRKVDSPGKRSKKGLGKSILGSVGCLQIGL